MGHNDARGDAEREQTESSDKHQVQGAQREGGRESGRPKPTEDQPARDPKREGRSIRRRGNCQSFQIKLIITVAAPARR